MRKVFLSFLGLGSFDKEQNKFAYRETVYEWQGKVSAITEFVQVAEQELLGLDYFDNLYIVVTRKSYEAHFSSLKKQLQQCRGKIETILLEEEMNNGGQWKWFEAIFRKIEQNDRLSVDLTHGYRSIPIIFSTAVNFLQKTKNIELAHVFYGAFEEKQEVTPLINMNAFFDVNVWADGVTTLTNNADASGIARAASKTDRHQFPELTEKNFQALCIEVTKRFKSVDMNNISQETNKLLHQIEKMKQQCSPESAILLDLISKKFSTLEDHECGNPDKNGYSLKFFETQLEFIRLLLDHALFMQAFTVMREWLASLVMLHFEKEKMKTGKRRKRVQRYGIVFFNMLQFKKEDWDFPEKTVEKLKRIEPFYDALAQAKVIEPLFQSDPPVAKKLSTYRNGFDHAWQGKSGMKNDIEQQGRIFLETLEEIMARLHHFLDKS